MINALTTGADGQTPWRDACQLSCFAKLLEIAGWFLTIVLLTRMLSKDGSERFCCMSCFPLIAYGFHEWTGSWLIEFLHIDHFRSHIINCFDSLTFPHEWPAPRLIEFSAQLQKRYLSAGDMFWAGLLVKCSGQAAAQSSFTNSLEGCFGVQCRTECVKIRCRLVLWLWMPHPCFHSCKPAGSYTTPKATFTHENVPVISMNL